MPFRDILVHVDAGPNCRERIEAAARLAQADAAHLVALNVRTSPVLPKFISVQFGDQISKINDEMNEDAARETRRIFDAIPYAHGVSTEWRDVDGPVADTVAVHARHADLVVIGQDGADDGDPGLLNSLVMAVGRPVLAVPSIGHFPTMGSRVLVAWNGSREATRAVHDALPILSRASHVLILAINPVGGRTGHGDVPGADLALHLSRHGVNAQCEDMTSEDLKVGQLLLSRASDEAMDMIVMGAYGRSRLSELVLGGATRHLLRHMTMPVLMSH